MIPTATVNPRISIPQFRKYIKITPKTLRNTRFKNHSAFFPKKLMARRDLADDTKLLFAVAMTDHCNMTVSEFSDFLINHVSEQAKTKRAKRELKRLAGQLDEILG